VLTAHGTDIARVIQLSVAPVFLLTAIGTILSVLSGRLARIVDRARALATLIDGLPEERRGPPRDELGLLVRRRHLVNLAITAGVTSALLVCVLIGAAFVGYLLGVELSYALAVLFIGAMAAFVAALLLFLREILVSVTNLRLELR
jgi:hypothetical protein